METAERDVLTHGTMPHRRLQAEAIRDAMLSNAGLLDPLPPVGSAAGVLEGVIPAQIIDRLLGARIDDYEDHRSIYLPIIRSAIPEDLAVFDFPEPEFVAGDRDETNVATQALYLMNGGRVQEIGDAFAARIIESSTDQRDRLSLLFLLAYGREPSGYEFRACRDFLREIDDAHVRDLRASTAEETPRERRRRLAEQRRSGNRNRQSPTRVAEATAERKAWSSLCQTIFQSSEFRTLD